ncbi:hypothetical protein ACMXYQ_05200 [Neptuniibacter sp. PT34_22]|uniref:hypothetical protein n=1 Tax=Neptuniibacter sp. PT34_22 TaxID=3398205 RepID=UPI0039F54A15
MKRTAYLGEPEVQVVFLRLPPDVISIIKDQQTKMANERNVKRVSRPLAVTQLLREAKKEGLI